MTSGDALIPNKSPAILLAEDDPDLNEMLADWLTNAACKVVVARRIPDAIMKLKNQAFDAIVTDFRFTEGTSEIIIEYIRNERKPISQTPIIVISGALDADAVKRIGKKVDGILVKPFKPDKLAEKLREVLGRKS